MHCKSIKLFIGKNFVDNFFKKNFLKDNVIQKLSFFSDKSCKYMYDIKPRYINHRSISSHEKRFRTPKKGISPERGMQYHFRRCHTHTVGEKLNKKTRG